MKGLFVLQTVLALRETALCCVLITLISGVALAQTAGTVDPSPAPTEPSTKEDMLPPGACMPIGVTVSGEIVFPFQCKDFIERQKSVEQKPAAAEEKPAAAEEKPATVGERPPGAHEKPTAPEEKAATKLPVTEESDNGKPAAEPTETGAIPVDRAPAALSPDAVTSFARIVGFRGGLAEHIGGVTGMLS